ncbi:MAG: NAD(P)H-hydrate dehydratase [Flavobacteriales bacterium]
MHAVVTTDGMRRGEAKAIAAGTSEALLMQRAGEAVAQWLITNEASRSFRPSRTGRYQVLCGPGNNGGDGLVVARLLQEAGMPVLVHRLGEARSELNRTHYEALLAAGAPVAAPGEAMQLAPGDTVVDALFGIGLDRPLDGEAAAWIEVVRSAGCQVVAVDVPSGLDGDGQVHGPVMAASATLTFEWPKLSTVLPADADRVGQLVVLPIGISDVAGVQDDLRWYLQDRSDLQELLHARPNAGHKGTFGHAVLVGGSTGRMGAMVLAAEACSRSGVGTVTAHVPGDGLPILQAAWPEAMGSPDPEPGHVSDVPRTLHGSAWGVGPGLGSHADSALVLKRLLQDPPGALVLDADALNFVAANPTWTAFLPPGTILTPHVREFERLAGRTFKGDRERWDAARDLAVKWGCVLVLKGATTAICAPQGRVFLQRWANSGMARGGSGDVLTGVLTGLRAQGYSPLAAACIGVYLHGRAGALVAATTGADGMAVHDVVEALPDAWQEIRS